MDELLRISNMNIRYLTHRGWFEAVKQLNVSVKENEVFGLVGESGSGKSTACLGLMRMLPPNAEFTADTLQFGSNNLLEVTDKEFRHLLWEQISYIPQSSMNSLNPVRRLDKQFYDTIVDHEGKRPKDELEQRVKEALGRVNLKPEVARKFPHELSGGMRQRVCIAMATLLTPKLIIADEPTSALDVISQRSVLEILADVRKKLSASMIMIGHDMALQAQVANRMGIMYAGHFVEIGSVDDIFYNPLHPYTQSLINALPSIREKQDIHVMAGYELSDAQRSLYRKPTELTEVSPGHFVANWEERRRER